MELGNKVNGKTKLIPLASVLVALAMTFQNCVQIKFPLQSLESQSLKSNPTCVEPQVPVISRGDMDSLGAPSSPGSVFIDGSFSTFVVGAQRFWLSSVNKAGEFPHHVLPLFQERCRVS